MPEHTAEIEYRYQICPDDGQIPGPIVLKVDEIRTDSSGWTARGSGEYREFCPYCGAVCQTIVERLPVQLQGISCPKCHKAVDYDYDLKCVETGQHTFTFSANATCPACSHSSIFKKLIHRFPRVKRLAVGPTGDTVDFNVD
jgi:hypothetical protein